MFFPYLNSVWMSLTHPLASLKVNICKSSFAGASPNCACSKGSSKVKSVSTPEAFTPINL